MASRCVLAIFVLIAAIVPMTTLATEYIVGDESGWTLGFEYHAWAAGKNFLVGDELGKIILHYPPMYNSSIRTTSMLDSTRVVCYYYHSVLHINICGWILQFSNIPLVLTTCLKWTELNSRTVLFRRQIGL